MTRHPGEKDSLMVRGVGVFDSKDMDDQVLKFDQEGDTIKQVSNKIGVIKNVYSGVHGPSVHQEGDIQW